MAGGGVNGAGWYVGIYSLDGQTKLFEAVFTFTATTSTANLGTINTGSGVQIAPGSYFYVFGSDTSSASNLAYGRDITPLSGGLGLLKSTLAGATNRAGTISAAISGGHLVSTFTPSALGNQNSAGLGSLPLIMVAQ